MRYNIVISHSAIRQLNNIPTNYVYRINKVIDRLAEIPRPPGFKKLKGLSEDLYRIRVGDYRIIYFVDDSVRIIDVRKIGHRKDIYNIH